jgi:hypothetical protein
VLQLRRVLPGSSTPRGDRSAIMKKCQRLPLKGAFDEQTGPIRFWQHVHRYNFTALSPESCVANCVYEGDGSTLTNFRRLKGSLPHKSITKNNVTFQTCTGIHVLHLKRAFDEQTGQIIFLQHIHRYNYMQSCDCVRDWCGKDPFNLGPI